MQGREPSVCFDPDTGAAFIRSTTATTAGPAPWPEGTKLAPAEPTRDRLARGVPALLAKLGIEAEATAGRNPPALSGD